MEGRDGVVDLTGDQIDVEDEAIMMPAGRPQAPATPTFPDLPVESGKLQRVAASGGLTDIQLYPFQQEGLEFMWRHLHDGGSILADEMGLGKTIQTIALVAALRGWMYETATPASEEQVRASTGVVLILVPVNVLGYWQAQLARHVPARHVVVINSGQTLGRVAGLEPASIVLATHTMFNQNVGLKDNGRAVSFAALADVDVSLVVVDEAHKFMNTATTNHKALRALRKQQAAANRCAFALQLLTGTPMGSDPSAVAGYFRLLQKAQWAKPEWWTTNLREDPRKLAAARDFILQRHKRDIQALMMPPKTVEVVNVPMDAQLLPVYFYLMKRVMDLINSIRVELSKLGGVVTAASKQHLKQLREWFCGACLRVQDALFAVHLVPPNILAAGGFLDGVGGDGGPGRLAARSTLRTAIVNRVLAHVRDTGRAVLLQSYWTRWLSLLRADLREAGLQVAFFNGSLNSAARVALTAAFQRGEYQVACLTLGCAEGITLTRATCVIDVGYWPNQAVHDQGYDRVYRIGQDAPVKVLKFCATTPEHGLFCCRTLHHAYVATHEARRKGGQAIMSRGVDAEGGVPSTSVLMRNIELVATKSIPVGSPEESVHFGDELFDNDE